MSYLTVIKVHVLRILLCQLNVVDRFIFFGRNSSIHGLCHVFREGAFIFVRIFWVIVVVVSAGFLYLILVPVLERGEQSNFTPDTRYLTWTTKFPAVTVCESYNSKLAQKKMITLYPDLMERLDYDFKKYVTELLYGRGTCNKKLCIPCGSMVPCDLHWRDMIESVHKKCSEVLVDCSFNGIEFPCCKKFRAIDSEFGYCFSFNTLQNVNSVDEPLYTVNISTGPGLLTFSVLDDVNVGVHSNEELFTDILDYKFRFSVKPVLERQVEFLLSLTEVMIDPVLGTEEPAVRRCRYTHEAPKEPFHNYPVYSFGACRLARHTRHLFEHCGCVHPVRDLIYRPLFCNFTGLNCLVTQEGKWSKYGTDIHGNDVEKCIPPCIESELFAVHVSKLPRNRNEVKTSETVVRVRMVALPTLRYVRDLIRSDLDFVVSIGGIVGLFFGASVLSIAEILYLIWRPN